LDPFLSLFIHFSTRKKKLIYILTFRTFFLTKHLELGAGDFTKEIKNLTDTQGRYITCAN